jgi:arsenate reductase
MITVYHNPRCRKSRETLDLVKRSGESFEIVEYLRTPLNASALKALLEKLQMDPSDLVRKGEALWKEKYRGKDLTDGQILAALEAHPILMERPVVVKGERAILGRPPEKVLELF